MFQLIIAIGIGTFISKALAMTGLTFPIYIGAMIAAACMRNIGEFTHKFTTHMGEINDIGGISLSLFLGIAMITLKLWQLAALALPLIILLAGQTLLIFLFTYFVIFNIMGRDYDAAVIAAGVCGFGMGATPNAMANMQALCEKYAPSVKAYLLILYFCRCGKPAGGIYSSDFNIIKQEKKELNASFCPPKQKSRRQGHGGQPAAWNKGTRTLALAVT